jgi:hypothetical protein
MIGDYRTYEQLRRDIIGAVITLSDDGLSAGSDAIATHVGRDVSEVAELLDDLEDRHAVTLIRAGEDTVDARPLPAGRRWLREGTPLPTFGADVNIGNVIAQMTGIAQGVGKAEPGATVSQIVNDPDTRAAEVEMLADRLLDEVRSELPSASLRIYMQAIEDLRRALTAEEPEPSAIQRLLGTLAVFGDVEGTISLTLRAWPHVSGLLAIAAATIVR